ncbi:MAG: ABC transporter ATP-binding protein [Ruminococcaceae bacterium]|nr:ABC transporter ATP-binding protein [Oscillospiraceae bacterium]
MISLKNIKKSYNLGSERVDALAGVSFELKNGEMAAIVGASGSGKSTLMNIIGCLDSSDSGEYFLNGYDISKTSEAQKARIRSNEIGFVFQSFNLLEHLTAVENVELPMIYAGISAAQRRSRAIELLKKVGLENRINHRPNQLSGGQQQRVSIARALSNNPNIILADEPTGALDSKSGAEIIDILSFLNQKGKTVIIITHDMKVASNAKKIFTMADGKIMAEKI